MTRLDDAKKKKRNGATSTPPSFHPAMMFCGECVTCAVPPPPISQNASFATLPDEESVVVKRHLHLRVFNARSPRRTDRVDILETILADLDGVTSVAVSKYCPPPTTEGGDAEPFDAEPFDPASCTVRIEYDYESLPANAGDDPGGPTAVANNPQEPTEEEEDDDGGDDDPVRRAVLARLSDARFDYAVQLQLDDDDDDDDASPSPSSSALIAGPPASLSCRSRIRVQGICCSSESPVVRSILKPLPGVRKLGINIATKVVFIDHDPTIVSASSLAEALNEQKFGATVLTDGGLEFRNTGTSVQLGQVGQVGEVSEVAASSSSDGNTSATPLPENILELPRSRFVESTFFIPGMAAYAINANDIKSCPVGKLLHQNFLKGHLRAFRLHAPSRTLKAEHDPELLGAERITDVLVRGLKKDDVDVDWGKIELAHDGAAECLRLPLLGGDGREGGEDPPPEGEGEFFSGLKINVVLSGILWVLSLLSLAGGSWTNLRYAGIGSVLFGMPPVATKALMTIRRMQFDANCMMVTAALGALALGEFDEAASVSFLFAVSEWLEARATGRARRALGEIFSLRPEYANVVDPKEGGIFIVPAANISVGTIVSVRTGDKVPADGVVVEGTSSVDESSLTGEARPVGKRAGDDVTGGSINVGLRQLVVKTTSTVGDSTVSRLIQLVEEAQANTSETEQLVDAFAKRYTPVVLAVAFLICTVPWLFGEETGRYWMLNGLIIMIVACPCALTISTPVTYSAGLAAAARRGIVIKGGSRLEALGNIGTVLFDKTGTITTGRFALKNLDLVGDSKSRRELLELLAIMEAPSSHPLSACLVSAAREEGVTVPANVSLTEHTILKGEGVTANVDGKVVYVGNERLFKRIGMYVPQPHVESAKEWSDEGATVGYVGVEGVGIVGAFSVKDTVRDEARAVISSLRRDGIGVTMITGDGEGAARAAGREVGLEGTSIRSGLLPEDKLRYVSGLKGSSGGRASLTGGRGLVMMVGDGVNDAPALLVADVGVAMGEGASLAMEVSDVTLMDSNLSKLLFSMKMGAKVIATVKENIAFSMLVNLVAVVLTFMGKMTLLWAIASDVGVMLLVTLNGMKLLSDRTIDAIEGTQTSKPASKRKNGLQYDELAIV